MLEGALALVAQGQGGTVIVEGPPEVVAKTPESYTGQFLAPLLPS